MWGGIDEGGLTDSFDGIAAVAFAVELLVLGGAGFCSGGWVLVVSIIKETYESNSGTAYGTYKEAVKPDSSIRLQDVKY